MAGNLLKRLFRINAGFFRLLFGGFFYRILVKIYYNIFRLKKSELARKALREIIDNQSVYWFIFILTTGFIVANLTDQNKPGLLEKAISRTIMANLITTEFAAAEEELIEETAAPSRTAADKGKYLDEDTLDKQAGLLTIENSSQTEPLAFNEDNDMVFKPLGAGAPIGLSGGSVAQRTEIVYYTVQNGDTASSIANRFGLTVNTILWANNLSAYSLIRPGDTLTILPYSGVLYTVKSGDTVSKIAARYNVGMEEIISHNSLGSGLKIGQKIILPGARKITETAAIARSASSYTGLDVISNLLKTPTVKSSGGSMVWPTVGHRITQYFSWRHNGLDIGNKVGTPIYAADDGIVEIASSGWNGGYGNTIVINHGGGKKTRYGHASKLFVKVGEEVSKGEHIAAMGSTGRSTGPHLHFEIIINGRRYNPLNYIR
ncbi:MAG: M23 family metallopeptidase [Patescibacteria group bacterium]